LGESIFTNLAAGTYKIAVSSHGGYGDVGQYGISGSVQIVLNPPANLNASGASTSQINLTWTDNNPNESGYKIERSPDGSSGWTEIADIAANSTSYSDQGLPSGTTFFYRIRAYGGGSFSGYSGVA